MVAPLAEPISPRHPLIYSKARLWKPPRLANLPANLEMVPDYVDRKLFATKLQKCGPQICARVAVPRPRALRPISGEPPKTSRLKPRTGTPAYSGEFTCRAGSQRGRAMQPPSPGDVFLTVAIMSATFLIEIGFFILIGMF